MANSYTIFTAERDIPMTKDDAARLNSLLEDSDADCEIEWDDAGGYFVSADNGCSNSDELPYEFLQEFGKLIGDAGLPFLKVGVAYTCDKWRPGSHGGSEFRIYPDGRLVYPEEIYPDYLTRKPLPVQRVVMMDETLPVGSVFKTRCECGGNLSVTSFICTSCRIALYSEGFCVLENRHNFDTEEEMTTCDSCGKHAPLRYVEEGDARQA